MRFVLACLFFFVHVASFMDVEQNRLAKVEVEVDHGGVKPGRVKTARKESTISKAIDHDALARSEKLTSDVPANCIPGQQIILNNLILALDFDSQEACAAACAAGHATQGCVAFDFSTSGQRPCRLARALGQQADPSSRRQYCTIQLGAQASTTKGSIAVEAAQAGTATSSPQEGVQVQAQNTFNQFGQQTTFGQPTTFGRPTTFGQPTVFGQPTKFNTAATPGFGVPPKRTFGQPTTFGQPATFGQPTAFGTPGFNGVQANDQLANNAALNNHGQMNARTSLLVFIAVAGSLYHMLGQS